MQDKNKKPVNKKGNYHGKWVVYTAKEKLHYICNYIDGDWYGYYEHHRFGIITKEYAAR
jgi:hypothetical protein